MSQDLLPTDGRHRHWRRVYRALLVTLPRALRIKHGSAMADLFAKELDQSKGVAAVAWAAATGLGDLVRRGLYERVMEERAALTQPNVQLLRSLGKAFALSFVVLTGLLIANYARRVPTWNEQATTVGTVFEAILYAIPFTASLTLPMAVFVAVFGTAGRNAERGDRRGTSASPRAESQLRLAPLVGLASLVALFAFGWNAEVVPRSNARLWSMMVGASAGASSARARNDRTMTLSELRTASQLTSQRAAHESDGIKNPAQRAIVANYDLEIHKKSALAAACVVFALLAAGIAHRVRRAGAVVQVAASLVVFTAYYAILTIGESLADGLVISPAVAMWGGNVVLLGVALLALRGRGAGMTHASAVAAAAHSA